MTGRPDIAAEPSLERLQHLQAKVRERVAGLSADAARRQWHPALSPMAWHLGHCVCVEVHWLRERVFGERVLTARQRQLFFPENLDKHRRAVELPQTPALLSWAAEQQSRCLAYWQFSASINHPLLRGGYLLDFIAQHYAQHLETMQMVRQQAIGDDARASPVARPVAPAPPSPRFQRHGGGSCQVGGSTTPAPYDNELPAFTITLAPFEIARRPVTNAEWLAFMDNGGYRDRRLWSEAGLAALRRQGWRAPHGWRYGGSGWYRLSPDGPAPLIAHEPVLGVSWYEASAFAHWARCRLPHEHEWEIACRAAMLEGIGGAWEWCANTLFTYPGFRAFPYRGYTPPWLDGRHFILRGASPYTEPEIRRPGFRNFYTADNRHIFAGLRLAR